MDQQLRVTTTQEAKGLALTSHSSAQWLQSLQEINKAMILQSQSHNNEAGVLRAKMSFAKMQMSLSLPQAMGGTQLTKLRKQDEDGLLMCLGVLISTLCESLNVGNTMNTMQAYEAACLLASRFWFLKLEEFIYIFRQGKTGEYGKSYNRIDVMILSEWCDKYWSSEERAKYLEEYHQKYKEAEKGSISLEVAKKLADVFQPQEAREVANPIEAKQTPFEEWFSKFKEKAELMTMTELRAWKEYGMKKGVKDVVAYTSQILDDYDKGRRTYPYNKSA